MPRVNPEVERLQRENEFLRKAIAYMKQEPGDVPFTACDNSCVATSRRDGMMTNGGCRCDEAKLRRAVMYWRRVAEFRQILIQELRNQ